MIYVPGADPIVHSTDEWTDWEMYAVLMRAAEMTADEEE